MDAVTTLPAPSRFLLAKLTAVSLPSVGSELGDHERFGDIDSVKAVSDLYSPIAGSVIATNGELDGSPELVNEDPYGKGWMIVLKPTAGLDGLMDAAAYEAFLGSLSH